MNAVTAGATQTFICDPGESVRECLREARRQRGRERGREVGGRRTESEEETVSVGYKFTENKALPTVLVMHQLLWDPGERRAQSHGGRETCIESEKGASEESELIPVVDKSVRTGLFQPELLCCRIYVTPERKRARDAEVKAVREHIRCVVLFGSLSCKIVQLQSAGLGLRMLWPPADLSVAPAGLTTPHWCHELQHSPSAHTFPPSPQKTALRRSVSALGRWLDVGAVVIVKKEFLFSVYELIMQREKEQCKVECEIVIFFVNMALINNWKCYNQWSDDNVTKACDRGCTWWCICRELSPKSAGSLVFMLLYNEFQLTV